MGSLVADNKIREIASQIILDCVVNGFTSELGKKHLHRSILVHVLERGNAMHRGDKKRLPKFDFV
jgi:hypothetical protein